MKRAMPTHGLTIKQGRWLPTCGATHLSTACTYHQPALLPCWLYGVAAAQAVCTVAGRVKWVDHASPAGVPRMEARGCRKHDGLRLSHGLCSHLDLGRCWRPGRHDVCSRLRRRDQIRPERGRGPRDWRGREPVLPGRSTKLAVRVTRPVLRCGWGTRAQMHHLNRTARRASASARNAQSLVAFGRRGLVVLEAGEDVIFVVHGVSGCVGRAAGRNGACPMKALFSGGE
jgi:hypothetical protein